jgi:hypothetical protein
MKIIKIPSVFQPTNRIKYPAHNDMTLEEFCFPRLLRHAANIKSKYSYLPIWWTTYYSRNNFGHDDRANKLLHGFVVSIKEPWFTISQYDDGIILNTIPGKSISMNAGGVGDIPLPLTCFPRNDNPQRLPEKYLASFVGNLATYKPWRQEFEDELKNIPGFHIVDSKHGKDEGFEEIMLSSRFALCPRGYGRTSFRLYEAMQMGTIPIYISDAHWLPFKDVLNWEDFCVIVSSDMIQYIPSIINNFSLDQTKSMALKCKQVWKEYFSYEGCVKQIVRILESL